MGELQKLIFDTSAINHLWKDKDSVALTRAMGLLYKVGITETAISEVIATQNEHERRALLEVLKRLLNCGNCIMPFAWIVEEQAKAYQRDPSAYDWKRLDIHLALAEEEIARQEFVHDLSEQTRREQKQSEKEFKQIYNDARPELQALFPPGRTPPSLREVIEKRLGDGGAHLQIAAGLIERATGTRPDESTTKDFIARCPPVKALLLALCFAQYNRCILPPRQPKKRRDHPGRVDMFSAVYLPYCSIFVTADGAQCDELTMIDSAEFMRLNTSVLMYDDFKAQLVGRTFTSEPKPPAHRS